MLLHVLHETCYDYSPAVKTAQHMAHLKPAQTARQRLLSHRLTIDPAPAQQSEATDVYGNTRAFFSLQTRHKRLWVVAESTVRTGAAASSPGDMAWEQVRERLRYHRGAAYDPAAEFVFASPYVPRHADFLAYARPSFTPDRPLIEAARELMARIHEDFEYESEATDVSTPALEALALRKGVCQDFAHIMLACLRSLGLPARYVSGYMLTEPPPGRARLVGADASHAWV
ncbi:MAG TPA: transglutaminase family protein, partial [Ramlibacter sp.]|nr:transglutaminase family protein [Ramlibacter sp.]